MMKVELTLSGKGGSISDGGLDLIERGKSE